MACTFLSFEVDVLLDGGPLSCILDKKNINYNNKNDSNNSIEVYN